MEPQEIVREPEEAAQSPRGLDVHEHRLDKEPDKPADQSHQYEVFFGHSFILAESTPLKTPPKGPLFRERKTPLAGRSSNSGLIYLVYDGRRKRHLLGTRFDAGRSLGRDQGIPAHAQHSLFGIVGGRSAIAVLAHAHHPTELDAARLSHRFRLHPGGFEGLVAGGLENLLRLIYGKADVADLVHAEFRQTAHDRTYLREIPDADRHRLGERIAADETGPAFLVVLVVRLEIVAGGLDILGLYPLPFDVGDHLVHLTGVLLGYDLGILAAGKDREVQKRHIRGDERLAFRGNGDGPSRRDGIVELGYGGQDEEHQAHDDRDEEYVKQRPEIILLIFHILFDLFFIPHFSGSGGEYPIELFRFEAGASDQGAIHFPQVQETSRVPGADRTAVKDPDRHFAFHEPDHGGGVLGAVRGTPRIRAHGPYRLVSNDHLLKILHSLKSAAELFAHELPNCGRTFRAHFGRLPYAQNDPEPGPESGAKLLTDRLVRISQPPPLGMTYDDPFGFPTLEHARGNLAGIGPGRLPKGVLRSEFYARPGPEPVQKRKGRADHRLHARDRPNAAQNLPGGTGRLGIHFPIRDHELGHASILAQTESAHGVMRRRIRKTRARTRPSLAQALVYPLLHQVAIQSEFHAGIFLELQDAVGISLGPGSGLDAQIERAGSLAVYQDLRVSVHVVDVHEVVLVEHGVELLLQKFRVLGSHPEHDLRTDVAENRIPYIFLQLGDELMGDGQGQPVFARFGQDARNARGSEILELVDIQVEIPALRFLRDVHPGKRGHKFIAGEDHAQEPRVDVPYPALGEIHQEYLAVVHHSPEIERGPGLADDGPHIVVRHEIIELGSDVRRHVREGRLAARLDRLLLPEVDDHRVLDARQLPLAVFRIGENARHLHQGGRLVRHVLHQKQKGVPHVLFEHGTHGLRHEQLVEDALHLVHDEGLFLRTVEVVIQHVQAHRPPKVAGVEINEVLHALLGDMPQDEVDQSAY